MPRLRAVLAVILGVSLVAGCTDDVTGPDNPTQATTSMPEAETTVVEGSAAVDLAVATSRALYRSSPAVVLVGEADTDALAGAADVAVRLGVPLLVTPVPTEAPVPSTDPSAPGDPSASASAAVARVVRVAQPEPTGSDTAGTDTAAEPRAEIDRLSPWAVLTAGPGAAAWVSSTVLPSSVAVSTVDGAGPPGVHPATPLESLTVLTAGGADAAAVATARAAGARILELGATDPRATSASVKAVAEAKPGPVLAIGSVFGAADRLRQRLTTAATGVELPGGGQIVFPGRRMVALYGHPGDPVLGVLGEQSLEATIERARSVAAEYDASFEEPVIPAFEIITTVASSSAGDDGNYSSEFPVDKYRPWVEAAQAQGIYVMLDLQPGRTDFLTQAKLYEELLKFPNVGLALDPEWRLKPDQVHLRQIGTVTAAELNDTGAWLAQLVRDNNLPQKVLMLHQFQIRMIENRSTLVTDYDELRVVIHADGFGSAGQKRDTWNALHVDEPANILWGWKNFYDEDTPTFTPAQTVAVSPDEIVFVSYQ